MKANVWLAVFGVVSFVVIAAAGAYAFTSYGAYQAALADWDSKVGTIESLERKVPFPNKANEEALKTEVEAYEAAVEGLFTSLERFQPQLNTTLTNTEFQQLVKTKIQDFRQHAQETNFDIELLPEFQLGFDSYSSSLPAADLVPILDYELAGIDHLLRLAVECGISAMTSFERDPIPGEAGAPASYDGKASEKYPIRVRFTATHESFQKFINAVANDPGFFYLVRVLKVVNESREGALKLAGAAEGDLPRYENPETKQVADRVMLEEWGYTPEAPESEDLKANAKAAGFVSSNTDARVLMGLEKLDVFMVIDITRFLKPDPNAVEEKVEEKGKKKR
jgi:hypothetical protein